jgi:predicted kinase
VFSSDAVRRSILGLAADAPAPRAAYGSGARTAVYDKLGAEAAALYAGGRSVIVDATFTRSADVAAFRHACPAAAGWIVCHAPGAVLLERARRREGRPEHGSDAGRDVVRTQLAASSGWPAVPEPPLAVLETTRPPDELVARLAAVLDARLSCGTAPPPPAHGARSPARA